VHNFKKIDTQNKDQPTLIFSKFKIDVLCFTIKFYEIILLLKI